MVVSAAIASLLLKPLSTALNKFFLKSLFFFSPSLVNENGIFASDNLFALSGPLGILKDHDILFENGKVKQIAKDIVIPRGNALVINGSGKHVTPGLIDAHSHMAGESINEGFQNITAEVRMQDVIDPNDVAMYRALAGGLTTINLLHGSANPIVG